jgi:uncharacterized protein
MPFADILIDRFSLLGAHSDAEELYSAGLARALGDDADIDLIEAHKWFNLAAAKGHEDAKLQRAEMAAMLSSADVKLALQAARDWLKLAN